MEHSYVGNNFVSMVEFMLSPDGMFYKSPLVWAGDYADNEEGSSQNLNSMAYDMQDKEGSADKLSKMVYVMGKEPDGKDMTTYPYILNHTMKLYVEKKFEAGLTVHPLPLLTVEGNGRGGGDFRGSQDLVGTWARHVISVEKEYTIIKAAASTVAAG
jgi:hypothetical protein